MTHKMSLQSIQISMCIVYCRFAAATLPSAGFTYSSSIVRQRQTSDTKVLKPIKTWCFDARHLIIKNVYNEIKILQKNNVTAAHDCVVLCQLIGSNTPCI